MSSRVIYTCDRCKREFANPLAVRQVRAGVVHRHYESYSSTGNVMFEASLIADWCDDCRRECHFFTNAELEELKKKNFPIPEEPTLEMQIRSLVEQMVQEAIDVEIEKR